MLLLQILPYFRNGIALIKIRILSLVSLVSETLKI
jgi:hypothetical protein